MTEQDIATVVRKYKMIGSFSMAAFCIFFILMNYFMENELFGDNNSAFIVLMALVIFSQMLMGYLVEKVLVELFVLSKDKT